MALFLAIIVFISNVMILLFEYKQRSASIFLWAGNLVFFGLSNLICSMNGSYSNATIIKASEFALLFSFIYMLVRLITMKRTNRHFEIEVNEENYERFYACLYHLLVLSSFTYCVGLIIFAGGFSSVSKDVVYLFRTSSSLILVISYIWQSSLPSLFYYVIIKDKKRTIVSLVCILMVSIMSSTRNYLIVIFVAFVLFYAIYETDHRTRKMILIGIIGIFAIVAMYLLRAFRYYYDFSSFMKVPLSDLVEKSLYFLNTNNGDIFLNTYFYRLIDLNNRISDLEVGSGYIRLLLLPIPSRLCLGLKPEDVCVVLGRFFGNGREYLVNYTVTPTLYGDCYANFGFFGVMLGGFWATIVTFFDRLTKRKSLLQVGYLLIVSAAFINISRGDVYNSFCNIFWPSVLWFVLKGSVLKYKITINKNHR